MGLVYLSLKADVVHDEHGAWRASGDSTEVAIAVLARKLGLSREKLEAEYKTVFANPFDQQKRYIEGAFTKKEERFHVFVGAPDYISNSLKVDHGFSEDYHNLAKEGLRVVGVCVFSADKTELLGSALLAIDEEVRNDVNESILEAQKAGFRVVMLTGDYPETAKEIARKVGIYKEGDKILTGVDVEKLSTKEIADLSRDVSVFARITPDHKMRIVHGFQMSGKVVAMTGDGVNDAPALQAANLGIAIGSGTQVAKDSSDIVLVDSNFETIVAAISEGRAIYLTLKKVILYLFSTSFGEVLVLAGAIIIGLPLPVLAVQIIWLNFVTDGFFVVALALQKPKEGLISKEETESENLVDRQMITRIITMGISMGIALPVFYFFLQTHSLEYARTMALLVLCATQWFNSLNVRSRYVSVFKKGMDNPYLVGSFATVFILQFLIIETPWGNKVMHTTGLTFLHWVLAITLSTSVIWVEEVRKLVARNK
jgi:Ca2+-transporting ATPase